MTYYLPSCASERAPLAALGYQSASVFSLSRVEAAIRALHAAKRQYKEFCICDRVSLAGQRAVCRGKSGDTYVAPSFLAK
jgi:hypothetical protein